MTYRPRHADAMDRLRAMRGQDVPDDVYAAAVAEVEALFEPFDPNKRNRKADAVRLAKYVLARLRAATPEDDLFRKRDFLMVCNDPSYEYLSAVIPDDESFGYEGWDNDAHSDYVEGLLPDVVLVLQEALDAFSVTS